MRSAIQFIVFILSLLPGGLAAMEFSIERLDLRPIREPTLHITAIGEIVAGDTEKLRTALEAADTSDVRDVLFMFDSPGGSLMESLELGGFIADIPAIVSAQVGSSDLPNAVCASACVYAYLAADYRYLPEGARIGIHQFGLYDSDLDGQQGAALGQALSGILSEYLRSHRVEPDLFEAISVIEHDDILWVPQRDLEAWRVVTNGIYDERAEYINVNGDIALRLSQIAITGDSFLTLFCTDAGTAGVADLHEPALAAYDAFEIAIDDTWHPVRSWDVVERSNMRGRIVFEIPPHLAVAVATAREIGARVVAPSGDIFFGFQQTLRDERLAELVRGCPFAQTPQPARPSMVELPGTDFLGSDLTTDGIRGISFARCKQICLEYAQCRAVSYVQSSSWCWPKSRAAGRRATSGVISAYQR
ncbi:hypothetical protein [Palleronia pelagia]|uniref:Apple domain-containing protein n=1 Tax=Palleronia pelagia TaxID=387096 RepID=A0A1H8MI39_9RHOB|nr:hypothetical protein [Palleronia pelagia]SEO17051.1 hypothetical protein SAMN04488011_1185 [Palleronia pelagia]